MQTTTLSRSHDLRKPDGRDAVAEAPHLDEPRSFAPVETQVASKRRWAGPEVDDDSGGAHESKLQNVAFERNTFSDDDSNTVVPDMETPADRLRQARIAKPFLTAADAARHYGWNVTTYTAHENGTRGLKSDVARRYAAAFGVEYGWLITGKGDIPATGTLVKVVGYVGAGAEVHTFANDEPFDGLDEIEAPAGTSADAKAVIVRGDSALPVFEEGEVLIWSENRYDVDTFLHRSKPMIVSLKDGRCLLKTIGRGTRRGLYTLFSSNAPPIQDVEIAWVARLDWTRPRR